MDVPQLDAEAELRDQHLPVQLPVDVLGQGVVHALGDERRVHDLGEVSDDARVLLGVAADVIPHAGVEAASAQVVHAQRHLEAVQAGDAIGLVLGDLEVHVAARRLADGLGHVAVTRVELEHLLLELGVPQRLPAVLPLALADDTLEHQRLALAVHLDPLRVDVGELVHLGRDLLEIATAVARLEGVGLGGDVDADELEGVHLALGEYPHRVLAAELEVGERRQRLGEVELHHLPRPRLFGGVSRGVDLAQDQVVELERRPLLRECVARHVVLGAGVGVVLH
mmetsp:Transcript_5925/g.14655  ORF Transcript_5925/g.14655 Transcript_5925/m.14655 type:complete len:282 (-) Transcript_5925:175-1020(-)